MDGKINESQLILMAFQLVIDSGCCPETTPAEWLKLLWYMHKKGWLYVVFEEDKLSLVVGAYRIPEFDETKADILPTEESGNILYVPFLVSFENDKLLLKKVLDSYLKHFPNITEIVFYERNNNERFKRIFIHHKEGGLNVKIESPEYPSPADSAVLSGINPGN